MSHFSPFEIQVALSSEEPDQGYGRLNFSSHLDRPIQIWIKLVDVTTNLGVWSCDSAWEIFPGVNYWIGLPPMLALNVGDFEVQVTGDVNFTVVKNWGTQSNPFLIEGVPFQTCTQGDMAFQTYVEVWLDRVYHQGVVQVQPGDVVVDVGANYGFFSLFAWSQKASRVVAVEPFPPTYECLRQNTQKFSSIQTLPVAVGAKSARGTMYPSRVSGSNFLTQNESWVEGSENIKPVNATRFEVQILTWPEILEQGQITKIDFLKVDCEGGEVDLFQNMASQHWDMLSKIAVEFHSPTGKEIILDLLSAHKFQIQSCSDGGIGLILAHTIKPKPFTFMQ